MLALMFVMKAGRAFTKFQVISFLSFEYYISIEHLISIEHDQKSMILSIKNVLYCDFPGRCSIVRDINFNYHNSDLGSHALSQKH